MLLLLLCFDEFLNVDNSSTNSTDTITNTKRIFKKESIEWLNKELSSKDKKKSFNEEGGTPSNLTNKFYAVCLDQRGHGESSWSEEGAYQVQDFARDLVHVGAHFHTPPFVGKTIRVDCLPLTI